MLGVNFCLSLIQRKYEKQDGGSNNDPQDIVAGG